MKSRLDSVSNWPQLAKASQYQASALAARCNVSLRQLERYIKHVFHKSPEAWLNSLRLQEAPQLLSQGLTTKEASFSLGFKHPSHFCALFKRHNGRTPREYAAEQAKFRQDVAQMQ